MAEPYIFISYSRHDKAFVERLVADLHTAGVRTWLDVDNIAPGANWRLEIERGLSEAKLLLYVASQHSAGSSWMDAEFVAFAAHNERVVPLIVDDVGEQTLPTSLRRFQWVDFRENYAHGLATLLRGIDDFRSVKRIEKPLPRSKGYVFISYAEEDSAFVDELKGFLAGHKYAYWDFRESERNYHSDLYLELEGVIKDAAGTLSILSPDWKQSKIAVKEFHFSEEVGTPVFLLKMRELGPTLVIAGIPYIDFTKDRQHAFAELQRELARKGL